jgi:carbamoyltransferase
MRFFVRLCLLFRQLNAVLQLSMKGGRLIVGLNKYSHDASCCIVDSSNGKVLFSLAKERITRRKHDGGDTGELIKYALEYLRADVKDIALVVSNNHHYRVRQFEKRAPFAAALGYVPQGYVDHYNLLPNAKHLELSHHLAHAYSAAAVCPFEDGLILCMDGMVSDYSIV